VTYLDTHAVIWLREGEDTLFSRLAKAFIEAETDLVVSPMVLLELENLHEIGRVKPSARQVMEDLGAEVGLRVCTYPFGLIVEKALDEKWTRDPFDRIIVAHARARNAALITKDEKIRRHYSRAVW
jgi:PIN domain nuclease of toxin-antitoxin system